MQIIDDVNSTIESLLKEREYPQGLPFDISFAIPRRDFAAVSSDRPTVCFYLYDIREDVALRSNEPRITKRPDGTALIKRPPVRIRLSYCVTAWGSETEDDPIGSKTRAEHKQLSEVLAALLRYPTIPPDVLTGGLKGQRPPLPTTVVLPDGMESVAQFWNALDGTLKPFLDYRVTFSLDLHAEVKPTSLVTAKISEYGGMAEVYVLTVRPGPQLDHRKGTELSKPTIERTPALELTSPADAREEGDKERKPAKEIAVSNSSQLEKGDVLMIVDGPKTEFCRLAEASAEGHPIPIANALLFDHEEGTELKRLSTAAGAVDVKLAAVASANSSELRIEGQAASKVQMGEVVRLDDSEDAEYFQITQVSGPDGGLGDSDTVTQFGGIVTNSRNAPLVGARVTLLDEREAPVAETTTDSEGRYLFRRLRIGKGRYTLKVEAQGYTGERKTIGQLASVTREHLIFELKP